MNRGLCRLKKNEPRIMQIKKDYLDRTNFMTSDLKYGDLTEKIIGCAMTVHRKMGGNPISNPRNPRL